MRPLTSFSFGQLKLLLLLLWALLCGVCQGFCAVPTTRSISPEQHLARFARGGDSETTAAVDENETELGSDLQVVKLLTASAIFDCGTEEGLTALSFLRELCDRRIPFDFESFEEPQQQENDSSLDQGERVISRLPKFLPDNTIRDFLESVQIMEQEGWMSTNPDSVDGLPSLHLNLVSNGKPLVSSAPDDGEEVSFESQIDHLYQLVRPFVYETLLPEANRLLKSNNGRKLRVSDVFLRRYGEDICGSVTRKGISIHYDVYSRITAVVALDEVAAQGTNGLFTLEKDPQNGETSNHKALRRFFPLTKGDCVLHTWDVLHGVDVEAGLDRTSLIVWFDEVAKDDDDSATDSEVISPWLSLEGSDSTKTTLDDGNDVRQFVLASALASASSVESEEAATLLYLTSASKGNAFGLTRMGSICEEGTIGDLKTQAFEILEKLRPFEELPAIFRTMLTRLREANSEASETTELACRFWLEGSLTGNPLAQKALADEVMLEASQSGNPQERLLAATLFALASQQEAEAEPSDSLARVIDYDVAAREVSSQEEFLASPVVQTASAALGGL